MAFVRKEWQSLALSWHWVVNRARRARIWRAVTPSLWARLRGHKEEEGGGRGGEDGMMYMVRRVRVCVCFVYVLCWLCVCVSCGTCAVW